MPRLPDHCAAVDLARRATALQASVDAPRSLEQHALERALGRPGVPWVRWAPYWLGCLRTELKQGWDTGETRRFKRLALHLVRLRPDLVDHRRGPGLWALSRVPWIREPVHWQGWTLDDPDAAFASLAEHLTARWPLPAWAASLLCERRAVGLPVFASLVRGGSIRPHVGTPAVPAPLTRAMVHALGQETTPSLVVAIRRVQVAAYGGSELTRRRLADAEVGQCLRGVDEERLLDRVIRWLCAHEGELPDDATELCEYLVGNAVDPTGRSVRSLVTRAEEWMQGATPPPSQPAAAKPVYPASGFDGAELDVALDGTVHRWTITELRTWGALFWEGRKMRHCVSTWAAWVSNGQVSVWSVRCEGRRVLTVGVQNRTAKLTEIRGRLNRCATKAELAVLTRWARTKGLEAPEAA